MTKAKFDFLKEIINKFKKHWLKGIEDVDW